ncbi:MAG: Sec-dependent nitrous-oxide reductase [Phycisphaerales bacterium]|nr:Sec-dependent nitrous-oxide reductase [Phycisphaerales bacterium]
MRPNKARLTGVLALALAAGVTFGLPALTAAGQPEAKKETTRGSRKDKKKEKEVKPVELTTGQVAEVQKLLNERKLTPDDLFAAAKTYMPSGRHDDYLLFASGGHSGQVFVIGVPSMRLLRSIAVFTPEPWQGYGYGIGDEILKQGDFGDKPLKWGDTHHPGLSETAGDYDGRFLFIGDKANARLAVIDLQDFETKQIVRNPLIISDHGCAFVTPDTDYVFEGGQYATPLGLGYAEMKDYKEQFRGMVTAWKFDKDKGRIDQAQSFGLELPPYWQDLFDSGKLLSDGFVFGNSINTELSTGKVDEKAANFEASTTTRDMDYLHIIDWKKAEQVFKAGKAKKIKDFAVITLDTAIAEGILHFAPEPKSPHGVDVTPDGRYIVVAGKLDPHVTVYSIDRIKKAIAEKKYSSTDPYGVPILDFDAVKEAQVELGLGPLHTQFDDKGFAYTSLFLDSAVARWSLGGSAAPKTGEKPWSLLSKTPVQYNVGHIVAAEGDTVSPDGHYLIAMNKWSVDRFFPTGPLLPQNFQLVDIDVKGDQPMPVLYDSPIGVGEPHYAQMIKADKLKPFEVYPEIGWNPHTGAIDPKAPKAGEEKIVRDGKNVEIFTTVVRSHFTPEHVELEQGDHVVWHFTNVETSQDATHGFCIGGYDINLSLEPGEYGRIEFTVDKPGTFPFYCTEFCSALHLEMAGYMRVKPTDSISQK